MRPWSFSLEVTTEGGQPLFLRIANAVVTDIRRGRLGPGTVLPGSRTLARSLGVHRNTVLAAYRDLASQGWVEAEARAVRVASRLPESPRPARPSAPHGQGQARGPAFKLPPRPALLDYPTTSPGVLSFGGGLPDLEAFPRTLWAAALRRAVNTRGTGLLGYGDPRGDSRLRKVVRQLLGEARGLAVGEDEVLITAGSQGGLDWAGRVLLQAGDRVAVEDPGYRRAWETLRLSGAVLEPLPVDEEGADIDALAKRLASKRPPLRAVYLTPHHQFPTTVTLAPTRRQQLLALARTHRLVLIEDDYDFEFHYEGRPVQPLARHDQAGSVIYLGTLSKLLAPGMRVGFLVAPAAVVNAIARERIFAERHGNVHVERAVAELIEEGLLQRQARKLRRLYFTRREILIAELRKAFGDELSFTPPAGGMSLWVRFAPSADLRAWSRRALAAGVAFLGGEHYDFRQRNLPVSRLGFSSLTEKQLVEAVRCLGATRTSPRLAR